MSYLLFNCIYALIVVVILGLAVRSLDVLRLLLRVASALTLISYPWDFFAIHFKAWRHPNPNPAIFTVPVNDLVFIFLCTLVSGTVFRYLADRRSTNPNCEPYAKHRGNRGPQCQRD
jgi:hypothetical protein